MRIVHRITENIDTSMQGKLKSLGVEVETGFATFLVEESHPSWQAIKLLIEQWDSVDIVSTKFTASEKGAATQLQLVATWHHGYPEPSMDDGYLDKSYDLTGYCKNCGLGLIQSAPFRMAAEPKWGKKHVLQLNWIFDEFFVLPETWKKVFKPFGIEFECVINNRTGKKLSTVVQLKIDKLATSKLVFSDDIEFDVCSKCERVKFTWVSAGKFPRLSGRINAPIFKSNEVFGSGRSASKAVIVSPDLFKQIKDHKLRGIDFKPSS